MSKKISIITIVLNGEKYIAETIKSVLSQKDVEIQYIIIDGGSTDETINIIEKFRTKIDILISEKDHGIYDAINKGIDLCKHPYVGIIHSGDSYKENILSKVVSSFEVTNADIVYGNISIFNGESSEIYKANHLNLQKGMTIYHPATFVKKEVYNLYNVYNLNYRIVADFDLFLYYYTLNLKFEYLDDVLANFRQGGVSTSQLSKLIKENLQIRYKRIGLFSAFWYYIQVFPIQILYRKVRNVIKNG